MMTHSIHAVIVCCLVGGCSSGSLQADARDAAAGSEVSDVSADAADVSADAADVSADAPRAGCAPLAAGAACRLSGRYDLTYDQVVIERTPDTSGISCDRVVPLGQVNFTAEPGRLCANAQDLTVSADGCSINLANRYRTEGGPEWWVNETVLTLTFASPETADGADGSDAADAADGADAGGALAGKGTARLSVSGFFVCSKTATVTARSR